MTKIEEAIEFFTIFAEDKALPDNVKEYAKIALLALDKFNPKSPTCEKSSYDFRCPNCNSPIMKNYHCMFCSQVIKWDELDTDSK